MALEWLKAFVHAREKGPDYADKALAAYALGIKAKGAIVGVAIEPGSEPCDAVQRLQPGVSYDPATTPRLPLPTCTRGPRCRCVYRPVMRYETERSR